MSRRGFQFLLFSNCLKRVEVPLSHGVLIASLHDFDAGLVQFLSRQSSFFIKLLAALVHLLLRVERLFRLLCIRFRLLHFFRQSSGGCSCVSGLGLVKGSLVFLRGRAQIPIFENRQQLSLVHGTAALDQKLLHRSADLRNNCRLLPGKKNRLGLDDVLNRRLFYRRHLHAHGWRRIAFILGAGGQQQT